MKVSVHIITYNQENYIAQTLDSVLMQKVNFDYEIVIGDDCSTDGTRQIVIDYQQKYPNKIQALLHEKNIGATQNDIAVHSACRGEYIAWLEGDDYWTSPYKLQKQVDFLDQHAGCPMCFHRSRHFYEDGSRPDYNCDPPSPKAFFTREDLLYGNFMPTCSIMVRRVHIAKLPACYDQVYGGDWFLQLLCAEYGPIGFLDEEMGATRIHSGGIWNGADKIQQYKNIINDYRIIRANLTGKDNPIIAHQMAKCYFEWAKEAVHASNARGARMPIVKSLIELPFHPEISTLDRLKLLLKVYIPGLYILLNQIRYKSSTKPN